MGNSKSGPATNDRAAPGAYGDPTNWGEPPAKIPQEEDDSTELVLQSWAMCKGKPSPAKLYRSDHEEKARRASIAWRKRQSFIELDCGDDSFFVSNTYKTIGVADGVGGWADEGIDPSVFPNALMESAKLFSETHRNVWDPETILGAAFERVRKLGKVGSSTALVASLVKKPDGRTVLDIANLGDGGLLLVRNRTPIYRVHEKCHGVNQPFQLACLPRHLQGRCYNDLVESSVREDVEVMEGDIIVMGTDGLFDNRFPSDIANEAGWVGKHGDSVYDQIPIAGPILKTIFGPNQKVEYVDPYRVTQRLLQDTYKTSIQTQGTGTPWAQMLLQFGVPEEKAQGGKVDDITFIISKVATRADMKRTTMW